MNNAISITLLFASVGIFFAYIQPTYSAQTFQSELQERSIKELQEERDRYVDALNKTREIEEVRTGLLEKYNSIPIEDRERLEKMLPDHIDSVRLIIDINNIASQYGMTLKNIGLTESRGEQDFASGELGPQEDKFLAVGLKFGVSGSYDNFRAFLKDLDASLRLSNITGLSFLAGGDTTDYSVTLATYRLIFRNNEHF